MDGLHSNHLQLTNQWKTHSAPRLEHSTTTKRKHNVSGTYQVHMRADWHTHIHRESRRRSFNCYPHLLFHCKWFMMCICRLRNPICAYIWPCALLPPVKKNERVKMVKKEERKSILSSSSWFTLISPYHYVYLCFWVCPSFSLAVKLSDGAGLNGIDHHKCLEHLSTDGGVYDGSTLHRDTAKPCLSIMLSSCWTIEDKCEKNWEERRKGRGKHHS